MKDFDKRFDTPFFRGERDWMFSFKPILIIVGIIILIFGVSAMKMGANPKKHFYTITVTNYQGEDMFWSDSIISQTERNVKFIDQFGFEKSVTGNFINITKIK